MVLLAFDGFRGTPISGGTTAGLAGLAGDIAAVAAKAEVLGYIPRHLPHDQPIDRRYTAHIASDGATFGAGDPLQYWTDFLLAIVRPQDVRVRNRWRDESLAESWAMAFRAYSNMRIRGRYACLGHQEFRYGAQ